MRYHSFLFLLISHSVHKFLSTQLYDKFCLVFSSNWKSIWMQYSEMMNLFSLLYHFHVLSSWKVFENVQKKKSNRPFIHYLIFYFRKRLMVILSDMGQAGSKGDIISAKRVLAKRLKVTECINYNYYSIYHFKNSRWKILIWIKIFKKRQIILSLVKEC